MKKIFALLFCLVMIVSMVGCAANDKKETSEDTAASTTETVTESEAVTETEAATETEAETEAPSEEKPADTNPDTMALVDMFDLLYAGCEDDLPNAVESMAVEDGDEETFNWITFTNYQEGFEAAYSESMIGSIAHSLVLVRVPDGTDVEAVRADIEKNHDPRKWICVEAEKSAVVAHNNTILLVMADAVVADQVLANFDALWA